MKHVIVGFIAFLLCFTFQVEAKNVVKEIDLSGTWNCSLGGTVVLPGTLDENHKGNLVNNKEETTHLSRLYSFTGKVTYSKTISIPSSWKRTDIFLHLERTKPATVFVDGDSIGYSNDISTPQNFCLGRLKSGNHTLSVVVDNASGVPAQLYANSHAYTEDTQTNWNGIIGRISIDLSPDCYAQTAICPKPCFKDFHIEGQHFYADGKQLFLRGKHDACVWPLTGHVPMDVQSWLNYLSTCKEYGINHIRFHSWCPPEAAFVAADSLGVYLQPELPFWGDFNANDEKLMTFLHKEGVNILNTYGRHPSFVMMALGNELWGSIDKMKSFVDDFRKIAPTKLFTFGSNYYLGYQGVRPGMDYFTTCRVGGEGWGNFDTNTRGSFSFADVYDGGMINHFYPNTKLNFEHACLLAKDTTGRGAVPVISHETGQFQTYPDFNEINKYTGVLRPYNLEVFLDRLKKTGMLSQAADFHRASGKWAVELYKADIEMDLRTKDMAGFQLLDIQDYPGQGSAYVGILDAFMESKGITTPEEWRQWCSPVVPLAVMDKYCYTDKDSIPVTMEIANYGNNSLKGSKLTLSLCDESGKILQSKSFDVITDTIGLFTVGKTNMIPEDIIFTMPHKFSLCSQLYSSDKVIAANKWSLWIYPDMTGNNKGILQTSHISDDIIKKLENGAKVLWTPDSGEFVGNTVGPLFQTDYWNYRMFKTICENNKKMVSPGTLGILTNPQHAIFNSFPTEEHTDWQWFPIIKNSHPLVLDNMPKDYNPIVQVIDNIERNHKLGLVMEFSIGKGKLLICMSDLKKAAEYPEGKAFCHSIISYMQSDSFNPKAAFSFSDLMKYLTANSGETKLKELNNISQY